MAPFRWPLPLNDVMLATEVAARKKTRDALLKLKILVTLNGKRLTSDCGLRFAVSYAKLDAKGLC